MARRSFRAQLPLAPRTERYFRWRGHQLSRLEGLSDAVFGFALTLLIVSTEVPRDYAGLIQVIQGFPAFVACFAILMMFWNEHYRFFRRYGLEDRTTRILNYGILLLVLFSVYPLKFLFSSWLSSLFGPSAGGATFTALTQLQTVYRIYGFGLAGIWLLYALLQGHALRLSAQLKLTPNEVVLTRLELCSHLINISVCLGSVLLSYLPVHPWIPGLIYAGLGPLLAINGIWHGSKVREPSPHGQTPSAHDRRSRP